MKKVIFLLILISGITAKQLFSQEQLLISNNGNNAKLSVFRGNNVDNTLSVFIHLQWVDDNLEPISENETFLVLHKDNLKIYPKGLLTCDNFKNKDTLEFNSNLELRFSYTDLSSVEQISFSFDFQKREKNGQQATAFAIKNPQTLHASYTDFDPPYISITNPEIKRGLKPIVDLNLIEFQGNLTDVSAIKYLKVDGKKVNLKNNKFSIPLRLVEKGNTVIVEAKDVQNNSITKRYEIEYHPPLEKQDISNLNYYALIIGG